jgi:nitrate reductase NapD
MNISGVVVRAYPDRLAGVRAQLEKLQGVEVHGTNPDGRLVVTVEQESDHAMSDAVVRLQEVPGVLSASMIYHQFEEDPDSEETM